MSSQSLEGLTLQVEDATNHELLRGLAAAHAVLAASGVTPQRVAAAIDGNALSGFGDIWAAAQLAAIRACCKRWKNVPPSAVLRINLVGDSRP